MSGIGHNGGPTMEPGFGFRRLAWKKARAGLIPTLPLQIVRIRVKRAERLGLDYRSYAAIRARTGRDIVGFLFSGNALDLRPVRIELPDPVRERLLALGGAAGRVAAVHAPVLPGAVVAANPGLLDHAGAAPAPFDGWSAMRERLRAVIADSGLPRDGIVLVAAAAPEHDWCTAGMLAGVLPAEGFFSR